MNIVFLLTQSVDSPSGLGRYAPLARQLGALGHQVTILALHPDFAHLKDRAQEQDGIKVRYVSQMHVRKAGSSKSYYATPTLLYHTVLATWRLWLAALSLDADIIHIGKPHPMNGIAGWMAHRLKGCQLWVDCDDYEAASGRFAHPYQQIIVAWFERYLPRQADHVTTNTRFMQQKLVSWGVPPEAINYLPNGVELERFPAPAPAEIDALRNTLDLHGCRVILYAGSLSLPSHPVDLLIEAFGVIHTEIPQARLVIAGGGEDLDRLQEMVTRHNLAESVRFCGRIPPEQMGHYYRMADVSVEPVHDNDAARGRCPLKLFESWACNTPFITADVGDRRSLLGDPPAGLLAQPGNPGSLAEAILELLRHPESGQDLAHLGAQRISEYTWVRLTLILHKAYLLTRHDLPSSRMP